MNSKEAEKKLLDQIKKSQEKLKKLREKRKGEIGKLAIAHNIDHLDNATLEKAFKEIAEKYGNEHSA